MNAFVAVLASDLRGVAARRWYLSVVLTGIVAAAAVVLIAAGEQGVERIDSLRADGASVLLLGGLVLALALGGTAFWRGIQGGHLGLVAAAGAPRAVIAVGRGLSRVLLLGAGIAVWTIVIIVGGTAIGRGIDTEFVVHGLAGWETLTITLLGAAAASTVLGPAVAATIGLMVHITAQATVNLDAAADLGRLGVANRLAHVAFNILPRSITSPMIAEMQNRDAGGPAAPQFEINSVPVPIQASSPGSVMWSLAWCGLLLWLCFVGLRRRNLN